MKKESPHLADKLLLAYQTEIKGHAFYRHAEEVATDEKGKNVFRHLSKEELEHIDVISAIADSIKKGGGWMGYKEALIKGRGEREKKGLPIFPGENELIEKLKQNETDQNAVFIAVGVEEKAVDFYGRMLKEAKEPGEKVFLTGLLEMEKGHLKILRWEHESLVKTGFWGDFMEYSVEKETE